LRGRHCAGLRCHYCLPVGILFFDFGRSSRVDAAFTAAIQFFGGGGTPPAPAAPALPRGSFLLAMQFFMNFARAAPASFWSSAPNLQVAIFSFAVTAKDGALGSAAIRTAAMKTGRCMAATPEAS
jgi:hypothetical protein